MTALTMMSADKNIDQGESSCSEVATVLSDFPALSAAAPASPGAGIGRGAAGEAATEGTGGADCVAAVDWAGGTTACCCACVGEASESIASAAANPRLVRDDEDFIAQPNSG